MKKPYVRFGVHPPLSPPGLLHLCEFIEDCEYPSLSIRILRLLADAAAMHNPITFGDTPAPATPAVATTRPLMRAQCPPPLFS